VDFVPSIRLGSKSLPGKNTLAYVSVMSVIKKDIFKNLTPKFEGPTLKQKLSVSFQ
jgi:hypothetical protein